MKILFIPEKNHYRDWISKTYFDIIDYYRLYSKNNINIIWSNEYKQQNYIKL